MAAAIQFGKRKLERAGIDPALKAFIDNCIVPALVREYLSEIEPQNCLDSEKDSVAECCPARGAREGKS
jgi:hypothetical protein